MKTWHVVLLKTHTHDVAEILYTYNNRGQAVSKWKGLTRKAIGSELTYGIRKG